MGKNQVIHLCLLRSNSWFHKKEKWFDLCCQNSLDLSAEVVRDLLYGTGLHEHGYLSLGDVCWLMIDAKMTPSDLQINSSQGQRPVKLRVAPNFLNSM